MAHYETLTNRKKEKKTKGAHFSPKQTKGAHFTPPIL
jgi:hypothetical protein